MPFNPSRPMVVARLVAGLLPLVLFLGPAQGASAGTRAHLDRARQELTSLESQIHAQRARLSALEAHVSFSLGAPDDRTGRKR